MRWWSCEDRSNRLDVPFGAETGSIQWSTLAITVAVLIYVAVLAISFKGGANALTRVFFLGLLAAALMLPLHRVECVAGIVLVMTIALAMRKSSARATAKQRRLGRIGPV